MSTFWNRWQAEYLSQLQGRLRWSKSSPRKITPGTFVLIKEDNVPPMQWPLSRITETHLGKDNVIRVVSVKTARSIVKRPMTKICILANQNDENMSQDYAVSLQQLMYFIVIMYHTC